MPYAAVFFTTIWSDCHLLKMHAHPEITFEQQDTGNNIKSDQAKRIATITIDDNPCDNSTQAS